MPFARCRYYSDSGEPVRGGCHKKGAGCAFVHPGDPDWNSAPPPSRGRDRGGVLGGFKGTKRGLAPSSGCDAGENIATSTTGARSRWGDVKGWGDSGRWGAGGGWGGGSSTSMSNQAAEAAQSSIWSSSSTTKPRDTSASVNERNTSARGNVQSNESGWGGATDTVAGSGWRGTGNDSWGSTGNDGWGASSWGNNEDADRATGSGWGNSSASGWGDKGPDKDAGSIWGPNRDAHRDAESARNGGSGSGENKDTTNSWQATNSMIVDRQETERNQSKGKTLPAPPRIRIPDYEKKTKTMGTNSEPLGTGKQRGESRGSNLISSSTPLTPTDSYRLKRKRDAAFDDRLDVFKEYVKCWERGVRARFLLAEAEAKRDRWFRTQKSACYVRVGEAGRKRLDGERAECDKEVNLQRDKLSSAITSLIQFHDTHSYNIDLGERYNIGEQAEKFITESKAFVDEARDLLVKHVLKDKNDGQSGDTEKHPSRAIGDPASIDSLRSQIRGLEERFDQAQTELTLRHQRDIHSEIDDLLATKIAALRMARQREIDRVASQSHAEIVIPPSAVEKMEGTAKQVRELDARIPQTVEDIRVLLFRVDATTKRVGELEEELCASKATYNEVQQMTVEKEETKRKMNERLKMIREQFEQFVASQPSGPVEQAVTSSAVCSSRDRLMESLRPEFEAVVNKFYDGEVQPTIEALRRDVVDASDRRQEEAIQVLWGKLQPAMNMVAEVSRWLDSQELGFTAPNTS